MVVAKARGRLYADSTHLTRTSAHVRAGPRSGGRLQEVANIRKRPKSSEKTEPCTSLDEDRGKFRGKLWEAMRSFKTFQSATAPQCPSDSPTNPTAIESPGCAPDTSENHEAQAEMSNQAPNQDLMSMVCPKCFHEITLADTFCSKKSRKLRLGSLKCCGLCHAPLLQDQTAMFRNNQTAICFQSGNPKSRGPKPAKTIGEATRLGAQWQDMSTLRSNSCHGLRHASRHRKKPAQKFQTCALSKPCQHEGNAPVCTSWLGCSVCPHKMRFALQVGSGLLFLSHVTTEKPGFSAKKLAAENRSREGIFA